MCGILFRSILRDHDRYGELFDKLAPVVKQRGPDSDNTIKLQHDTDTQLVFYSSVLSLRLPFTPQPIQNESNGHILQFNGELYNDNFAENDTRHFFDSIEAVGVLKTLETLRGEYAFVYYDTQNIWFARDCIGRRSLLYSYHDGELFITSVSLGDSHEVQEVPGGAIFKLDTTTGQLHQYQWGKDIQFPYGHISTEVSGENRVEEFQQILKKAVNDRQITIPEQGDTQLAILFSGGLDCTLLASILDEVLPRNKRVDLLNVAFENPRTGGGYDTPDRKLGRQSWRELNSTRFRFVEINVPYDETVQHRPMVQQLMYPKDSVMDLSIAVAFYFASRGKGTAFDLDPSSSGYEYHSKCKVLFSGLGADELFGGYSRHSRELIQRGYSSLANELQMDFDRLHERNLGRDDRVCTVWGKEMRYPFLDENVVRCAMQVPLDQKVVAPPSGEITKYLLRQVAETRGLTQVSTEKKRAIQFGAKSAKMEVGQGRIKGHEKLT